MKSEIKIPAMGESITDATIGTILKPAGAIVSRDEEILELETDKVNQVLHAPQSGLLYFSVKQGDTVQIGQVIGYVETSDNALKEKAQMASPEKHEPAASSKDEKKAAISKGPAQLPENKEKQAGKSTEIRTTKEDFIAEVLQPVPPSYKPASLQTGSFAERKETRRKMSKIRKVIAARLVEAQQSTAMLTTFNEIDMSEVILLREKYKESFEKKHGTRLGFMSFFVKAAVAALQSCPDLNSYIDGDEIVHREYYDIGIAVGTEKGLIVPVVRSCDALSFAGIEKAIAAFAKKAKEGGLLVDDLQGGGFTITNGGVYGSLLSTPILNSPQSGILGMHKIEKRAVVVDDQIVIRPMMYVALSYDHRIVDGKEAVSFLVLIKQLLEDPARFILEI